MGDLPIETHESSPMNPSSLKPFIVPALISTYLLSLADAESDASSALFQGDPIVISKGHEFAEGMAFDADGHFYFTDVPAGKLFRVDAKSGEKSLFDGETGKTNGIAMGPDGALYGCAGGAKRINRWDLKTGEKSVVAEGPHSNDIAITDSGIIFFTDPKSKSVWRVSPAPERKLTKAAALDWRPNGLALNPDQDGLFVADFQADTIHRFPVAKDGALGESTPAYVLATGDDGRGLLDGMVIFPSGNLLIGTARGIQLVPPISLNSTPIKPVVIPPFGERPRCNYLRLSPDGQWLYAAFQYDIVKLAVRKGVLK